MEQEKLPNGTLILVFGILSIVTCCCYGVLGLIFGVIALVLAKKATDLYKQNPEMYSDYGNVKTGRVLAIIGIVLSVLYLLMTIGVISFFGWEAMNNPELMQERMEDLMD